MSCGSPISLSQPIKNKETRQDQVPHPLENSFSLVPLRLRASIPIHESQPGGSSVRRSHPFKLSFFRRSHFEELLAKCSIDAQLERFSSSILAQSSVAKGSSTKRLQPIAEKDCKCIQLKASTGSLPKETQKSSFMSLRHPQSYTHCGKVSSLRQAVKFMLST